MQNHMLIVTSHVIFGASQTLDACLGTLQLYEPHYYPSCSTSKLLMEAFNPIVNISDMPHAQRDYGKGEHHSYESLHHKKSGYLHAGVQQHVCNCFIRAR